MFTHHTDTQVEGKSILLAKCTWERVLRVRWGISGGEGLGPPSGVEALGLPFSLSFSFGKSFPCCCLNTLF